MAPQPVLDRDTERGMAAVVGRVREDPAMGIKYVVLTHNTIRGAAGASVLNAELLAAEGCLGRRPSAFCVQDLGCSGIQAWFQCS